VSPVARAVQSAPACGRSDLGVAPGAGAALAIRGHTTQNAYGTRQADGKFQFISIFKDVL